MAVFFLRMWQCSFNNEVISLIDKAMLMEPPTAGMIRVILQGKFVQVAIIAEGLEC